MAVDRPVGRFKPLLKSLNCDGTQGILLLAACAALFLPEIAGDAARALLRYERAGLTDGEWWRLLSAHFVHLDLAHTALNTLGVVLMWAFFARDYAPRQWAVILLASILAIDAGLWFLDPDVAWYVGASGILHGVMAAGTLAHLRRRDLDGWILAVFVVGKLAYEQWTGALPFSDEGVPVVVNAHLYGAVGGIVAALPFRPRPL